MARMLMVIAMTQQDDPRLTTKQIAHYIGISEARVYTLRAKARKWGVNV